MGIHHVSVWTSLLVKLYVFVMTYTVSNRKICFIKAVLLFFEHGHFSQIFRCMAYVAPPPHLLGLMLSKTCGNWIPHVSKGLFHKLFNYLIRYLHATAYLEGIHSEIFLHIFRNIFRQKNCYYTRIIKYFGKDKLVNLICLWKKKLFVEKKLNKNSVYTYNI